MITKCKASMFLLAILLGNFGASIGWAQKADADAAKVKDKVAEYGVGKKVSVKLNDGSKFKGRISEINADDFSVKPKKGNSETFSYGDVAKIKKSSLTKWITIGAVAAGAVIAIVVLTIPCRNEGSTLCL